MFAEKEPPRAKASGLLSPLAQDLIDCFSEVHFSSLPLQKPPFLLETAFSVLRMLPS